MTYEEHTYRLMQFSSIHLNKNKKVPKRLLFHFWASSPCLSPPPQGVPAKLICNMCSLIEKTTQQRHVNPTQLYIQSYNSFYIYFFIGTSHFGQAGNWTVWVRSDAPPGDVRERSWGKKKGDRWKGSRVRCHDSCRGVRTASRCQGDPISQRPRRADVFGKSGWVQ